MTKRFRKTVALKDVSFLITKGELLTILGPSGSGKTTLLRILSHIEKQDSGHITYPDRWTGKNVLVFQDYLLFPHLSVFENIAFGLRAAKIPKNQIEERVNRYLRIFSIEDKGDSFPNQLSGGQRQRVAIARAMVLEPALLLLDEPFANLDKQLKLDTARFIKSIQRELGTTTICVTHDLDEAFAMSDRLGVLIGGEIHQMGEPSEVYYSPQTKEVARLLGPVNVIPNTLAESLGLKRGGDTTFDGNCYIRREALSLTPSKKGEAVIVGKEFVGMTTTYRVDWQGNPFDVLSTESYLEPGARVDLSLSEHHLTNTTIHKRKEL